MKAKYKLNEIVKIKSTGEKAVVLTNEASNGFVLVDTDNDGKWNMYIHVKHLSPYRPSRTGKFRDAHGRFRKETWMDDPTRRKIIEDVLVNGQKINKELKRQRESAFCQSFVDEDGVLTNCTCGKCKAVLDKGNKQPIKKLYMSDKNSALEDIMIGKINELVEKQEEMKIKTKEMEIDIQELGKLYNNHKHLKKDII